MQVTAIGLDLAKHVFQVHGVDAQGQPVLCRRLRRSEVVAFFAGLPACLIGMEACATVHSSRQPSVPHHRRAITYPWQQAVSLVCQRFAQRRARPSRCDLRNR